MEKALGTLAVLIFSWVGFLVGLNWPARTGSEQMRKQSGAEGSERWHVPKRAITLVDTLIWSEELTPADFQIKLQTALETMPLASLRALARKHRELAYTERFQRGYTEVHDTFIRRAPWDAVADLVENMEWERSLPVTQDDDLNLETMISKALAQLYTSEPERVLDVFRSLKTRVENDLFVHFEAEALLAVVEAASESEAFQAVNYYASDVTYSPRALQYLGTKDPELALEKVLALPDADTRSWNIQVLLKAGAISLPVVSRLIASGEISWHQVLGSDPELTLNWARELPVSDPLQHQIAEAAIKRAIEDNDHERASAVAAEFSSETESESLVKRIAAEIPGHIEWLSARDQLNSYDLGQWIGRAPDPTQLSEAAYLIVGQLPPTRNNLQVVGRLANGWAAAQGQGDAAVAWAESLQAGGMRHEAVVRAIHGWSDRDGVSAAQAAAQLEPVELRIHALGHSLMQAIKEDSDATRKLLRNADLPDETRERYLERVDLQGGEQ